jgi:NADH dehydrogenase
MNGSELLRRGVLVLGGSGFLGRTLCDTLVDRGAGAARVVVPTRREMRGRAVQLLPGIEVTRADLHDDTTLARLLTGVGAVVNLVAIRHGSEAEFRRVHVELPRRLAAACASAGVRRVVHVGALGVSPQAPSRYLRSKSEGERVLKSAGLELTILRPSVMFGAGDRTTHLFASLQAVLPLLPLAAADAALQPVWVADVAEAIGRCLDDRTTIGETIECAGPERMSLRELVQRCGRWAGHPRPILGLPNALARLQALAFELLPGDPLLSRDDLDSLKAPNVASGTLPGLQRLGITPSAFDAVAPSYLSPRDSVGRLNNWRALARR